MQTFVHYFLHFGVVGLIAYWYDSKHWWRGWLVLCCTMLVDADHLLADPLFNSMRCSIGFHPLHSLPAIVCYVLGALALRHRVWKLVAIGLLFHMFTDLVDCLWMFSRCAACYEAWEVWPLK
jgi:hypothetical protein